MIYDHDDAVAFIAGRTGLTAEVAEKAEHTNNVFNAFAGLCEADPELYPGVDFAALRKVHPDLLPISQSKGPLVTYRAQTEFLVRVGALTPAMATQYLAAATEYMVSLGITDDGAVDDYRAWATEWLAGRTTTN